MWTEKMKHGSDMVAKGTTGLRPLKNNFLSMMKYCVLTEASDALMKHFPESSIADNRRPKI
jgi:hypothetical protein